MVHYSIGTIGRFQIRRCKKENLTEDINNIVLEKGEPFLLWDTTYDNTIKKIFLNNIIVYIGDGSTKVRDLQPLNGKIRSITFAIISIFISVVSLLISIISFFL